MNVRYILWDVRILKLMFYNSCLEFNFSFLLFFQRYCYCRKWFEKMEKRSAKRWKSFFLDGREKRNWISKCFMNTFSTLRCLEFAACFVFLSFFFLFSLALHLHAFFLIKDSKRRCVTFTAFTLYTIREMSGKRKKCGTCVNYFIK